MGKKFTKRGYQPLVFWPVARVRKENWETVGERPLIGQALGVGGASCGVRNNERTPKKDRKRGKEKKMAPGMLFEFSEAPDLQAQAKFEGKTVLKEYLKENDA